MQLAGLIGHPVGHSLSALMHNAEFARLGLHARYELWDTPREELEERVKLLRGNPAVMGFNVTVPWKMEIMPLLDTVDSVARVIGAVNTVVRTADGRLSGYNTDSDGWVRAVHECFGPEILNSRCRVLLLGGGGVARAVAAGCLCADVAGVTVACRRPESARALLAEMKCAADAWGLDAQFGYADLTSLPADELGGYDLVVNCTSAGMEGHSEELSPLGNSPALRSVQYVYDTIYRPAQTRLMKQAVRCGCRGVSNGLGMLVWQGALAFERWTGLPADPENMRQALRRA